MELPSAEGDIRFGNRSESRLFCRARAADSRFLRHDRLESGASLLELLSVSAVIVLMAGLLYSSISSFSSSAGRRGAVNVLMNTLEHARVAALESGQTVFVGFSDDDFPIEDMRYKAFVVFRETSAEERAAGAKDYLVLRKWTRLPGNVALKRVAGSIIPESGGQTFPGLDGVLPDSQATRHFRRWRSTARVRSPVAATPLSCSFMRDTSWPVTTYKRERAATFSKKSAFRATPGALSSMLRRRTLNEVEAGRLFAR